MEVYCSFFFPQKTQKKYLVLFCCKTLARSLASKQLLLHSYSKSKIPSGAKVSRKDVYVTFH